MKAENILQLTEIDSKDNSSKNFFLGEWCKKYEDIREKNRYNGFVQEHHWKNKRKREKDIIYIENLYEKLIVYLKNSLNDFHQEKKNELYWRVVLGPWLLRYITSLFDRWETMSNFFSKNSHNFQVNFFNNENDLRIFINFPKFLATVGYRNEWNYLIYKEIIQNYYSDRVQINKVDFDIKSKKEKSISRNIGTINPFILFKKFIKRLIPNFLSYIIFFLKIKLNKIIITDLDISYGHFLKMCFSLKIIPSKNSTFLDDHIKINKNLYNLDIRKKIFIDQEAKNKFEDFLFKNIFVDIPISYIEGYKIIKKKIDNILTDKKKIILSNYSHLASDAWKIWIAEMLQKKSKLITYMHGGGFPLTTYDLKCSEPMHELKISTKRITWFKYTKNPSVQLSPLKAINLKNIKYTSNKNKFLSIIVPEIFLHTVNLERNPLAEENIDQLENCFKLIKNVNPEIQNITKFKMNEYGNTGRDVWYVKKAILEKYGHSKIYKKETNIREALSQSKFVIITYPQTTLSETLISNIPFVLFYDPSHWDVSQDCEKMINTMKENKLYFDDPKELSVHLNKIWPSINEWWNSQTILEVRNYLKIKTANLDINWKNEWVNFLKNVN